MKEAVSNEEKQQNYKIEIKKLTKALNSNFYFEAIFIEYAIIEDCLSSVLSKNGKTIKYMGKKLNSIHLLAKKDKLISEYFSEKFLNRLKQWKDKRNPLVHSLVSIVVDETELSELASEGDSLIKELIDKTNRYINALKQLST